MKYEMKKYKVKLVFKYSDVVHVEAENEEDAIMFALDECQEEYECFYDSKVTDETTTCPHIKQQEG